MRVYIILAAIAMLAGCAKDYSQASFLEVMDGTKIEPAAFNASTRVNGPMLNKHTSDSLFSSSFTDYSLRAWITDGVEKYQLYVEVRYYASQWRNYRAANLYDGSSLETTTIRHDVVDCDFYAFLPAQCDYEEIFGISIPKSVMDKNRTSSLLVRVRATSGDRLLLDIPENYMSGFITKVRTAAK